MELTRSTPEKYQKYLKSIGKRTMMAGGIMIIASIIIPMLAATIFSFALNLDFIMYMGLTVTFIGLTTYAEDVRLRRKRLKEKYKKEIVATELNKIFTDVKYDHNSGIPREVPVATEMIKMGNRYYSNDLINGKYKGIDFMQADVVITSESEDTEKIIFRGRWLVFEFPKKFNYRLQVVGKLFKANKTPKRDEEGEREFKKITTESPSFNEKFDIYAEDEFEAYYILDPAFMDYIEKINAVRNRAMMLMFIENTLNIAIWEQRDTLEPIMKGGEIDQENSRKLLASELKLITDFVEYLRLDRKLYKKT